MWINIFLAVIMAFAVFATIIMMWDLYCLGRDASAFFTSLGNALEKRAQRNTPAAPHTLGTVKPVKRSTKDGERLTDDERALMSAGDVLVCPDCQTGTLQRGPEAGMAVNVLCPHCGAKFNIMADGLWIERLNDRRV